MDIRQLKYFLAVAEEGLVTKAAVRLHITQSPLSQQIIILEKELGTPLFVRTKKHLYLTEAGKVLKRRAEQILALDKNTIKEVRDTAQGIRGKLAIGIINSSGRSFLPEIIREYIQLYPHISFDLQQGDTNHILELLDSHLLDVGFVRLPIDDFLYNIIPVPAENMILAALPESLATKDEELSILVLKDKPLLVQRRYLSCVSAFFHQNDLEPHILCTSDEIIPLLTWALAGLGVAIVPEFSSPLLQGSSLLVRKIIQPLGTDSSALVWRKNTVLSAAVEHFITLFRTRIG